MAPDDWKLLLLGAGEREEVSAHPEEPAQAKESDHDLMIEAPVTRKSSFGSFLLGLLTKADGQLMATTVLGVKKETSSARDANR